MTTLIFGKDEELALWAEKSGIGPFQRPLTAIGVAGKDGKIMAVAIYNNYRYSDDIEISFVAATPRWATQGNIRAMLSYPFVQLGVKRLSAVTNKNNKRSRKLLTGLGTTDAARSKSDSRRATANEQADSNCSVSA